MKWTSTAKAADVITPHLETAIVDRRHNIEIDRPAMAIVVTVTATVMETVITRIVTVLIVTMSGAAAATAVGNEMVVDEVENLAVF